MPLQQGSVFALIGDVGLRIERVDLPWVWVAPSRYNPISTVWDRVDRSPEFEPAQLPASLFADLPTLAFDSVDTVSRPERINFQTVGVKLTEEQFKQRIRDWLESPEGQEELMGVHTPRAFSKAEIMQTFQKA